jgi:NAD(P)-dependent dehydrogenase (short-subunit alcohol dehydrogenase family)
VVAGARRPEELGPLVAQYGERVKPVTLEVRDEAAAKAAVQLAADTFGRLDVLVNNAGYGQIAPFEQISPEDFQAVVDTCFNGVVYTTRAALPVMRKQKSGHIFQVSSIGGRLAIAGNTPYHAAKWAVGGFSDALAMEVAPFGVKICTLEPGGIRTNWARRAGQNAPDLLPEYEASVGPIMKLLKTIEGRQEGDPRKIADLIVQLANSDEVPVRLILGVDAEKRVDRAEEARANEARKWRHLTRSTVFENAESIPELLNH